jgi:hypothetical protein
MLDAPRLPRSAVAGPTLRDWGESSYPGESSPLSRGAHHAVPSGRHDTPAGSRPSCPRSVLLLRPPARTSAPHGQHVLHPLQIQANKTGRSKFRFGTISNRRKGDGRGCCAHRRGGVRPAACYGSTARSCGLRDKRTTQSWRGQGWWRRGGSRSSSTARLGVGLQSQASGPSAPSYGARNTVMLFPQAANSWPN